MATRKPTATIKKFKKKGKRELTQQECCDLVMYQLGEIAKWEMLVWNQIWGSGGGSPPPPPPTWPPA